MEDPVVDVKLSTSDSLKNILAALTTESNTIKGLIANVRSVLKDVERQSKDYDKLVNKRSRTKGERKSSDVPSGITKPVAISDELALFLEVAPGTLVPRNEVTKGVSAYVKKNELSDPSNRQKFLFTKSPEGDKLFKLLGNPTEEVTYFNLQRYLKTHYIQLNVAAPKVEPVPVSAPVTTEAVAQDSAANGEKKKTKIVVKKKKDSAQLQEE
jgi:chromatin remodeling complex protein RSC6